MHLSRLPGQRLWLIWIQFLKAIAPVADPPSFRVTLRAPQGTRAGAGTVLYSSSTCSQVHVHKVRRPCRYQPHQPSITSQISRVVNRQRQKSAVFPSRVGRSTPYARETPPDTSPAIHESRTSAGMTQPGTPVGVGAWLKGFGLQRYEGKLIAQGFDSMQFMRATLSDQDIKTIVGNVPGHVSRLIMHRDALPEAAVFTPAVPQLLAVAWPPKISPTSPQPRQSGGTDRPSPKSGRTPSPMVPNRRLAHH